MALSWEQVGDRLDAAASILNRNEPISVAGPLYAGVDLGTADVVLMVLDAARNPVAAFLEWANVVRDGVVVDFLGAIDVVKRMLAQAQKRLGVEITAASTSFPPGTDQRLSTNILDAAGLDLIEVRDEPCCVASLMQLDKTAVVDVGGGTTGTAVVQKGQVVFSGDEPTGGHHITLTVAGHFGISYEEAERRKLQPERFDILDIARPTFQRISDIVASHIKGHQVERIVLSGGTCLLPGADQIFSQELGLQVILPNQPLLLTPLAIASLPLVSAD
jgi:ethanolamine utilization protein EutJ